MPSAKDPRGFRWTPVLSSSRSRTRAPLPQWACPARRESTCEYNPEFVRSSSSAAWIRAEDFQKQTVLFQVGDRISDRALPLMTAQVEKEHILPGFVFDRARLDFR